MNNIFKDFEWRKEEVDKLRVSEHKIVNISIEGSGYGDGGWRNTADMERFENEVYQKLRDAGYTINNPTMSGASHTLTANDIHTSLYLHPTSFTGYAKPNDIEQITAILNDCSCLNKATVVKAADCYDLTDAEYTKLIYAHAKEISECLTSKASRYDIGFEFAEKHRIDRVGDKASGVLSSSDVDIKAVEAIYDIAKNLGYFEERAKQEERSNIDPVSETESANLKDDFAPLYIYDMREAKARGELALAKADYQYNRNCAKAIDRAINGNFVDNHFNSDAAFAAAVELSGYERVAHVVAAQIANHDYDGRYDRYSKEWAKDKMSEFSDTFIERSREYYLSAHPVLIDSFANKCIEFEKTMAREAKVAVEDFAKHIEDAAMRTPQYFGILSELKSQLNSVDYFVLGNNKDEAIKEFAYTLLRDAEVHDCYHTLKSIVTEQLAQTVDKLRNNETEKWEVYGDENFAENGGLLLTAVYALAEERGEWKAIAHDDVYNARFADILNDVGFQLESHENGICTRDTQLNEYVTEIDEDTIAYFKSATEIVERLNTFISDSFINDLEDEFADWNMEGEMPDSNFGAWLEYAEKCKNGTEREQEFYDSHKEEFKDMKLLTEDIDKVDISKIAGNVEKGREDQKQNPNKKKSDYTNRE